MEQAMYEVQLGKDYPLPVIDLGEANQAARDKLYAFQKRDDVQAEGRRILARHTLPDRAQNGLKRAHDLLGLLNDFQVRRRSDAATPGTIHHLWPITLPLLTPSEGPLANGADFAG